MTAEQIIEHMKTDLAYYQEWIDGMVLNHLNNDDQLLKSWSDWFEGR
jgi:hypothetical protein